MSNVVHIETTANLDRRAKRIKALMNDMTRNALALGKELIEARDTFELGPKGHPMGWKKWLREEFDIAERMAAALIQVYRRFGDLGIHDSELPSHRVLRLLLPQNVPEDARKEVIERSRRGEKVGRKKTQEIIKKHLPSPKKANELARETGKPVAASDGYVYFGATDAQRKEAEQRLTVVFSVREAIACLAAVQITGPEFLQYAMPHQLWKPEQAHVIKDALAWLKQLDRAWDKRK